MGFAMMLDNNNKKEKKLKDLGDTFNGVSCEKFIEIIENEGFELLSKNDYQKQCPYNKTKKIEESSLYCFWNEELHILAHFESYPTTERIDPDSEGYEDELFKPYLKINSAKMHYSIKFDAKERPYNVTSSGSMTGGVWVGSHDIREGFLTSLTGLKNSGTFVPWIKGGGQFLYLKHYMLPDENDKKFHNIQYDEEKYNYETITKDIINSWEDKDLVQEVLIGNMHQKEYILTLINDKDVEKLRTYLVNSKYVSDYKNNFEWNEWEKRDNLILKIAQEIKDFEGCYTENIRKLELHLIVFLVQNFIVHEDWR
jgi:hypothetical protein